MTLIEAYKIGKRRLQEKNVPSASFDAMCLFEHCFRMDRQRLLLDGLQVAEEKKIHTYFSMIEQRANRRPLQYILGQWEFNGISFQVGEGVLVPREDTEVLVEECLKRIQGIENPVVFDLCGGSGAVAISIAKKREDAKIFCIELSEKAYAYLLKNIMYHRIKNIEAIQKDVLTSAVDLKGRVIDAIVSNPPYIPTKEIKSLQEEVQHEPTMALDGGADGLVFYRAIIEHWLPLLNPGGSLSVEIGINQSESVKSMFLEAKMGKICILKDMNGIDRVISGIKKED